MNNFSPVPQLPPCSGFTSALLCPYPEEMRQCQLLCWRVSEVGRAGQHLPETQLVLAVLICGIWGGPVASGGLLWDLAGVLLPEQQ